MEKKKENAKLLSLLEDWIAAKGSQETNEDVLLELWKGESDLYIETLEYVPPITALPPGQSPIVKLNFHESQGMKFFAAFTDGDLVRQWMKVKGFYLRLPVAVLMQMAQNAGVAGIVINTGLRNSFIAVLDGRLSPLPPGA